MKRNRIRSTAAFSALAVCLSACLYPDGFRKETGPPASHIVTRIGDAAYRIDVRGLPGTSRQELNTSLLAKAAAVTLESGCDYFIVSGGEVLEENEIPSIPFAGTSPESPSGALAEGAPRLSQRYSGSILFHVFKGRKPPDDPLAFDAREVSRKSTVPSTGRETP